MKSNREYWNGPKAAHRRVMLKASGYTDNEIKNKPHIGVANSFMEGSPGSAHLRQIAEAVKQGIWAAGGIPVEFGIPATCGNVANGAEELKYEQAGRDIVAMSIEFVTKVHHFDGLVMVASCDNIIAGTYLAAARLDIPSMIVTGGSMQPGNYRGKKVVEAELDVAVLRGDSEESLADMEEHVCPSFGACPSMGTANTMQMLGEVFNLVLPGTGTIPASDNQKIRKSREAGSYVVELVKKGIKPSDLITRETLLNSIMVDMAVAGSTNAVLHILSMAVELDIDITMKDFDELASEIPCICGVIPSGSYTVVDFHYAGGIPVVMKMLEDKLHTNVPTMLGNTWKDVLKDVRAESSEIIRSLKDPLFDEPGLKVLRGNLSPNGAIVRPTGVPKEMKYFRGKAKTFDNDFHALKAIESGDIVPEDVIVIRYEGCKGAPGMKEVMLSTDALVAKGLHTSVGLVTDARFSGFNYGAIVGHVSPEAYDGGVIALVEDGDIIVVDLPKGEVTLEVSDEELAKRRKNWVRPEPKETKGLLALFAKNCRPAEEGGAMQPW
ncbi:dihydroxy-acid dehydratase [Clostridioides mangenotii]|uniref:dihydroxy-acid dehydratase n=1 Tax=Metaclostridioides mangenotii TaxID=1540 RepID=UPI002149D6FD|nr:dihydroxy-acid dehydratase [Clostridioides mangenotii]MCR1955945.1 dihydroxy-acid dehydratase [Clostridioides mangenotii]